MPQAKSRSLPTRVAAAAAAAGLALVLLPAGVAGADELAAPATSSVEAPVAPGPGADTDSEAVPDAVNTAETSNPDAADSNSADAVTATTGTGEPDADAAEGDESESSAEQATRAVDEGAASGAESVAEEESPEAADASAPSGLEALASAAATAAATDPVQASSVNGLPDTDRVPLTDAERAALIDVLVEGTPGASREHLESLSGEDVDALWLALLAVAGGNPDPSIEEQAEAMLADDWAELVFLLLGEDALHEFDDLVQALYDGAPIDDLVAWYLKNFGGDRAETEELVRAMAALLAQVREENESPGASESASTDEPTTAAPVVVTHPVTKSATPVAAPATPVAGEQLANTGASAWGPAGLGLVTLAAGGLLLGVRRVRVNTRKH